MRLLPRLLHLSGSIAFLLSAAFGSGCYAQTPAQAAPAPDSIQLPARWDEPVGLLADKIAAAIKPIRTASLGVKNISSLDTDRAATVRQALVEHLAARRLRIEPSASATCDIQVTLSEAGGDYVWVAEIKCDDVRQVVMVSLPKGNRYALIGNNVALTVQRNLLRTQDEPFLDFAKPDSRILPSNVLEVLSRDYLMGYESVAAPIPQAHSSRDARGRLSVIDKTKIEAQVGETRCTAADWSMIQCSGTASSEPWIFAGGLESRYAAGRNYFTGFENKSTGSGALNTLQPFYSVTTPAIDDSAYRIATELDGKARLYEWSVEPTATFSGWGDDIASITTTCDSAWHVLVTGTGDWTQPDQIQIYDIKNHQAIANGAPLQFPGPILALWPAEDGKTARVVSRNLKTGMYEASIVSVSCGD
jgi:hypothetical protein